MNWTRCLAVSFLALLLTRSFAGPLDARRVPDNAVWVVHIDVERLKETEMGKFLMEELSKPEAEQKLAAAQTVFDFDPRKDLQTVTMFGTDLKNPSAVVLAQGRFDPDRLATLAGGQKNYQRGDYAGVEIHQWDDEKSGRPMYAAFPAAGWVVAGPEVAALKAALDVLGGRRPPLASRDSSFLPKTPNSLPVMVAAVSTEGAVMPDNAPPAVKDARSGALILSETAGEVSLEMVVEFANPELASQVRDMAAGFIAMAALNAQENPELAEIAQKAQVSLDGPTARLRLRVPAAKLRAAAEKAAAERSAPATIPPEIPAEMPEAPAPDVAPGNV